MPEVTLSLPVALGLLALFLVVGAIVVFVGLSAGVGGKKLVQPTAVPTETETPTDTPTPTDTSLPTVQATFTVQAPFTYTIHAGDTCSGICSSIWSIY